jgi:hypothetical protein
VEHALQRGARLVEVNPEPAFEEAAHLVLRQPAGALLDRAWVRVATGR